VFSILPQTTITIVGVLLHVYTYVCIWAKTGEYLAVLLAFVDLWILFFVGQIKPTRGSIICPTIRIYKSTNRKMVIF